MLSKNNYEGRFQVSVHSLDERVFADMKEKHGMRWTTLRGLRKVSMQAMLVFACMNLKKLATWLWKPGGLQPWPALFFIL